MSEPVPDIFSHALPCEWRMTCGMSRNVCVPHLVNGLRQGLSLFSEPSRAGPHHGRAEILGWENCMRVFPILDMVLDVCRTLEKGAWPKGKLVFVESRPLLQVGFLVRFPPIKQPRLRNFKHVRKLLVATENSDRKLARRTGV